MNQTIFEWLIIGISAPLAGIGVAMYLDGNIGISFMRIYRKNSQVRLT